MVSVSVTIDHKSGGVVLAHSIALLLSGKTSELNVNYQFHMKHFEAVQEKASLHL
jgi:hypothetical protein